MIANFLSGIFQTEFLMVALGFTVSFTTLLITDRIFVNVKSPKKSDVLRDALNNSDEWKIFERNQLGKMSTSGRLSDDDWERIIKKATITIGKLDSSETQRAAKALATKKVRSRKARTLNEERRILRKAAQRRARQRALHKSDIHELRINFEARSTNGKKLLIFEALRDTSLKSNSMISRFLPI